MNPLLDTTAYCTVDQVLAHGLSSESYTTEQIEDAITLITAYIDAFYYCNLEDQLGVEFSNSNDEWQHFVRYNDKTKKFSGEGHYVLPLRGARLIRLTGLIENDSAATQSYIDSYIHVKPRVLYKYANSIYPYIAHGMNPGVWIEGVDNIEVTGDWGYAAIPRDIQLVATRLVIMYLEGMAGDGIASFASIAGSTYDSTATTTGGGEIKSFKTTQPGSETSVTFFEPSESSTSASSNAVKAAVDSGLYLHAKTTGDSWSDSILAKYKYKPYMGIRVF